MTQELLTITSGKRLVADSDWPVEFQVSMESDGNLSDVPFVYDPNDPYGEINPQIAAWLLSNPDFTIDDYVAPDPPPDPVPSDFTLSKRQIMTALILSGTTLDPEGFIKTAIDAITDPTTKALALVDWQAAPYYVRTNPLFSNEDMLTAVGMTSTDIDNLWMLAKDQPV